MCGYIYVWMCLCENEWDYVKKMTGKKICTDGKY